MPGPFTKDEEERAKENTERILIPLIKRHPEIFKDANLLTILSLIENQCHSSPTKVKVLMKNFRAIRETAKENGVDFDCELDRKLNIIEEYMENTIRNYSTN